jgi:Zn-dependent alcohol dehydrogenase
MAIDLAMQLPLERIVTHSFSLRDVTTAFNQFKMGKDCKVLILPREQGS